MRFSLAEFGIQRIRDAVLPERNTQIALTQTANMIEVHYVLKDETSARLHFVSKDRGCGAMTDRFTDALRPAPDNFFCWKPNYYAAGQHRKETLSAVASQHCENKRAGL